MPKLTPRGNFRHTFDFEVEPGTIESAVLARYLDYGRTQRHQILAQALLMYFCHIPDFIKALDHKTLVDLTYDLKKSLHWLERAEQEYHPIVAGNSPPASHPVFLSESEELDVETAEIRKAREAQLESLESMF
jgi:hypothetical protein